VSAALRVIGGGLAGCEAAWQAAEAGLEVELVEMRPVRRGPAHQGDALA
jgi:methylenetetrahydrofolate--tRNA-(uracil-5-)-methyltransferase